MAVCLQRNGLHDVGLDNLSRSSPMNALPRAFPTSIKRQTLPGFVNYPTLFTIYRFDTRYN